MDLPRATVDADMHCVTGWTTLDNTWEGVSFRTLAERARPTAEAKWVIAHGAMGYTSNLSLEAMDQDDVLVAWRNHGEDLTPEHGWPLRLVVPKRYAWKSAKWLTGLEFSAKNVRGFWEVRGYHVHGEPFAEERYSYQEGARAEMPAVAGPGVAQARYSDDRVAVADGGARSRVLPDHDRAALSPGRRTTRPSARTRRRAPRRPTCSAP